MRFAGMTNEREFEPSRFVEITENIAVGFSQLNRNTIYEWLSNFLIPEYFNVAKATTHCFYISQLKLTAITYSTISVAMECGRLVVSAASPFIHK